MNVAFSPAANAFVSGLSALALVYNVLPDVDTIGPSIDPVSNGTQLSQQQAVVDADHQLLER